MKLFLKLKIWLIEADLRTMLREKEVQPKIWSFGAYDIDPQHLVFVVGVQTDEEKERLRADTSFGNDMRSLLNKWRWPEAARSAVIFDVESEETVNRETKGNWWYHYK